MEERKLLKIERVSLCIIFVMLIIGGALFGVITAQIKNFSGIDNLKKFQPSIPTRIYDINGELIAELFQEKRELASFEELPHSLINAFLAAEDRDFYSHIGIDPIAIARAMGKNIIASVKAGRPVIVQGGSTITQQLAKRLFTGGERKLGRKVLEAILAFQIEKKFSKDEILEMYFNQIYLGHGCHGIATAAQFFFDKDVRHLSVAESSILAALPSKPNGFSPLRNPKDAYYKNRDTLNRMVAAGFIQKDYSDKIYREFWPRFIDSLKTIFPTKTAISKDEDAAPYFTDYVRQILISRFGKDSVYNDGLSVYTTLNLKRQKIGQHYLQDGVTRQNEKSSMMNARSNTSLDRDVFNIYHSMRMVLSLPAYNIKNDVEDRFRKQMADEMVDSSDLLSLLFGAGPANKFLQSYRISVADISTSQKVEGALIAIEPSTGYITTMVGGSEFQVSNQYNRAVQARRQPGSAFKPFVYGAAIEKKRINPATALPDAPIMDIDAQGMAWSPGNYEGDFSGMVMIRKALAASINIISVRIYDLVGADTIISYASRMLKVPESRFNPNPSLALGTTELTPFELANAYAIYANRGRDVVPFAIRYIVDRDGNEVVNIEEEVGKIIALKEADGSIQVISEEVAFVMTSLMRGVIDRGTANDAIRNKAGFKKEAAGKTGTTSNWTDAWFCGFTSDLAAVVWIGYDRPFMSLGKHQAGSGVAGPIWGGYLKDVYNGMPDPKFPGMPPGVYYGEVCKYTGLLPSDNCKETVSDVMIAGSGPSRKCSGRHYKMKSVLERYMEKEGLTEEE